MVIQLLVDFLHRNKENTSKFLVKQILSSLKLIKIFCSGFSTCDGCPFQQKYKGCAFRNKIPREW